MKQQANKYYTEKVFQALQRLGEVAYKWQLLAQAKIHDVFHFSLLEKANSTPTQSTTLPRDLCPGQPLEHVAILDRWMVQRGRVAATQVLVCWFSGFLEDEP